MSQKNTQQATAKADAVVTITISKGMDIGISFDRIGPRAAKQVLEAAVKKVEAGLMAKSAFI